MSWDKTESNRVKAMEDDIVTIKEALTGSIDDPDSIGILGQIRITVRRYANILKRVSRIEYIVATIILSIVLIHVFDISANVLLEKVGKMLGLS